ncbi:MAG: helix-turn-helix domain-containing protein [Alphaproteobacteria bacterium]|nr:helix-turn-helix domain-containing protein [Alphaproteobacteria bacterium]
MDALTESPTSQRQYLRTVEAASFLGLSRRTLEKWRCVGGGPVYFKFGRVCLYQLSDLKAWADAGRRTSTSDPGGQTL